MVMKEAGSILCCSRSVVVVGGVRSMSWVLYYSCEGCLYFVVS